MTALKLVCLSCAQANRVPRARLSEGAKCGVCGAPLLPAKPVDLDPETLGKAARQDDLPLLVDFWAPWCGPCRMMAPEFAKASAALAGKVRFAKIDTQAHPAAGQIWGIRGIPTMIGFTGGREKARQSGALPAAEIRAFAERLGG